MVLLCRKKEKGSYDNFKLKLSQPFTLVLNISHQDNCAPVGLFGAMALEVKVFLEVKRLIQAAQLIVDITSCSCSSEGSSSNRSGTELQCGVEESSVLLSRPCGCECDIRLHCNVMPDGCSGMRWVETDGLHLRLPVTSLPKRGGDESKQSDTGDIMMVCASCQTSLSRSDGGTINRMLPLPSSNWSAAAEQFYCPCKPNRPAMYDGKFIPQLEGDCLEGLDCWIVKARNICQESISLCPDSSGGSTVSCKECREHIGHAAGVVKDTGSGHLEDDTRVTLLRGHVLSLSASTETCSNALNCPCHLEDHFCRQLLDTSHESGCSKFVLHGYDPAIQHETGAEQPFSSIACLWLMSSSIDVLLDGSWSSLPPLPRASCAMLCSVHSRSRSLHQVLQVLYKTCDENSSDGESWLLDASAQPMPVSNALAGKLLSHLKSSTAALPPSLRSFNGFQVGYLFRLDSTLKPG